jgi:ADP-ribose pyrophosphatase
MSIGFRKIAKDKAFLLKDSKSKYCKKKYKVKTFKDPDGNKQRFFIDAGKDAVIIFGLTKDQKVILVKQFRPGPEKVLLECPGGGLEPAEDMLAAATRELEEETGYTGDLTYLTSFYFSAYGESRKHLFLAKNCEKVSGLNLDKEEFLEVALMSLESYCKNLMAGKVKDVDISFLALAELGKMSLDV